MKPFPAIRRAASASMRTLVGALIASLDGLNGLVGRLYDRFDADYSERTKLLRARYARRTPLAFNPPASIGGVAARVSLETGRDVDAAA